MLCGSTTTPTKQFRTPLFLQARVRCRSRPPFPCSYFPVPSCDRPNHPQTLQKTTLMMKTLRLTLLLSLLCFGIVRQTNAQSTFAGSFCAPPNPNPNLILPVGDIALTLDDGQVSFKCMLLSYMPTTNIVAWLAVGPKQL